MVVIEFKSAHRPRFAKTVRLIGPCFKMGRPVVCGPVPAWGGVARTKCTGNMGMGNVCGRGQAKAGQGVPQVNSTQLLSKGFWDRRDPGQVSPNTQ